MTYIITFEVFMLIIKNFTIKVRMTVHKASGFLILEEYTVLKSSSRILLIIASQPISIATYSLCVSHILNSWTTTTMIVFEIQLQIF